MSKNYYFDMDGVAVIYDRNAYKGKNPIWLRKNQHYFRNLEPDRKILEVMDTIHQQSRYTSETLNMLTSLPMNGAIFNEHFHDKILWNRDWLPYLDINNILISVTSKRDAVEFIHDHALTKDDVLIDDWNKNLVEWKLAGGTAIKYCNGLNSPDSWDGPVIYNYMSAKDIVKVLRAA